MLGIEWYTNWATENFTWENAICLEEPEKQWIKGKKISSMSCVLSGPLFQGSSSL